MKTEIIGRVTIQTEYSKAHDNWTVLIKVDEANHLFTHYSCDEMVKDEVVGLAKSMAKALQVLE